MAGTVVLDRDVLIDALRHLEVIVSSLDRIGSAGAEWSELEFSRRLSAFIIDWDVGRRLAEVRKALSQAFGEDELDELFGEVDMWTQAKTTP